MDNNCIQILSDITVFAKYAKYVPNKQRRESWKEICGRNKQMHLGKFPYLKQEIESVYKDFVEPKKVLMSMRSAQFAGKPIELNPARMFNCSYLPIDDYRAFSETMFLLLGGTGVGYSVQQFHIRKLPEVRKPIKKRRYVVADSIEGWADSIKMLMRSYFEGRPLPAFDYRDIREKGTPLVTSGGKAPGPGPLKDCHHNIIRVFDEVKDGEQLSSLQCHDIMCYIADAVLAGGIRRAATISLFDIDDEEMLTCKFGNWSELHPHRARANNSAVVHRSKIDYLTFQELWHKITASGNGEPGIFFTNDINMGANPCLEVSLREHQFCNLTEVNMTTVETQEDFESRCKAAAFLGTLQASYTDFHYLRPIWKKVTEREALLGVSLTGIASNTYKKLDIKKGTQAVLEENKKTAERIGINPAARCTCIKPAGTTSLVLGSSSGIHAWHSKYYIRRVRLGKDEPLAQYLMRNHPELIEDEFFRPTEQIVVEVPQRAPDRSTTRERETAISLLERIKKFSLEWIKLGHRKGSNYNNVSATISVKEDEWRAVGEWMWDNKDVYTGLSVSPYDGHTYTQAPFEEINKAEYEERVAQLRKVYINRVKEIEDSTNLQGEIACGAEGCEV